jgi:hypothetical protein
VRWNERWGEKNRERSQKRKAAEEQHKMCTDAELGRGGGDAGSASGYWFVQRAAASEGNVPGMVKGEK